MLFCAIETTAEGWPDGDLRRRMQLRGLPSITFLEADGRQLLYVPHQQRTVAGFRRTGQRAEQFLQLRAASERGDRAAAARYLRMLLEERKIDLAEARRRRPAVTADPELAAVLDRLLLHLRIETELRTTGQRERHRLGPRFYALWTGGPRPGPGVSNGYWFAIFEWAERERRVDAFAAALAGMAQHLRHSDPDATWVGPLLARYEEKLKMLRRAAKRQ